MLGVGSSLASLRTDWDRDTDKNVFIVEAVSTLTPVPLPTEKLGAQVVGLVQEVVLGALEPGLGAGTQVL